MPNTLEQGRANFAFDAVNSFYDKHKDKEKKEYRSHVKKIPMLIKTNGLGATYAFALTKKDPSWKALFDQTEEWLRKEPKELIKDKFTNNGNHRDLAEVLITLDSTLYRAVTVEVMALFNWMRRFAEGLLKD